MSEIEAAVFGRFLPIKCPDEKVKIKAAVCIMLYARLVADMRVCQYAGMPGMLNLAIDHNLYSNKANMPILKYYKLPCTTFA